MLGASENWLQADGQRQEFDTLEEAEAAAERMRELTRGSMCLGYKAMELDEPRGVPGKRFGM